MPRTEQMSATETELSKDAIRAVEEGRADHVAGRKFSIAEIKRELGKSPDPAPDSAPAHTVAPSRCLHGERVVFIDTD